MAVNVVSKAQEWTLAFHRRLASPPIPWVSAFVLHLIQQLYFVAVLVHESIYLKPCRYINIVEQFPSVDDAVVGRYHSATVLGVSVVIKAS